MSMKIALKRLSASDCTFFEGPFRRSNVGNQKGINLNADVLVERLYPSLPSIAAATGDQVPLRVNIYGPGGKPQETITRKIIKTATYKNWRLNGETVRGPISDHTRYDGVTARDIAVMVFHDDRGAPHTIDLILVSQSDASDSAIIGKLTRLFDKKTMVEATAEQLALVVTESAAPANHPIRLAAFDPVFQAELEDAVSGGLAGTNKILHHKSRVSKITASEVATIMADLQLTGQDGEAILNGWFQERVAAGQLHSAKWTSADNAFAPYDFLVKDNPNSDHKIDAKTTKGPFTNTIHISMAELTDAAGEVPYRINRLYEINEDGAKMTSSHNINEFARNLVKTLKDHMPPGVVADSFSVSVDALTWNDEVYIKRPHADDEES